ncbi:MAG: CoA transferase, partial [Anaerolineaceae bacterium]
LRVADLSMGWAGPMAGTLMASFGADVIKVESHTHFDWWRGSRPPGDDLSLALWERSHVFNGVNRGKRGITLNLHTPRGNELARELIGTADVVIENFGAGVLEKLGLTYATLSAANPRLIMLRQPGFGSTGPEAGYLAFGNTIEGMSGLTSLIGYEDGPPTMMSNAFGDPISGLNGTLAVCAALHARERDGCGRLVECAQLEGFIPLVSEPLIAYQLSGNVPARHGNYRPGHTPSGVFPCGGDDEWLALEVENDGRWAALAHAIGEPWASAPELATEAGRSSKRRELDAQLVVWTRSRSRDEALEALVAAGVPAAPVHNEAELLFSEPFADAGFWENVDRAYVGTHLYPGLPMTSDGVRPGTALAAPLLGEHNVEVLSAMGLSAADIADLRAENVIGELPRG